MDPVSLPRLAPGELVLDGRLGDIRRMDAEQGRAAAARELGVAFLTQLIEAMRRTMPENSLFPRSPGSDVYDGLFDRELAGVLAAGDPFGLVARLGGADRGSTGSSGPARPAAVAAAAAEVGASAHGMVRPGEKAGWPGRSPLRVQPAATRAETEDAGIVVSPVDGTISSPYGPRLDPISGQREVHRGIDLAAPAGTPVRAVAAGRVVASGWAGSAGRRIVIEHGAGYRSVYAHAGRALVDATDRVVAGQIIATVGSSGRTTGPHLHFEVYRNGVSLDPAKAGLTAPVMTGAPGARVIQAAWANGR